MAIHIVPVRGRASMGKVGALIPYSKYWWLTRSMCAFSYALAARHFDKKVILKAPLNTSMARTFLNEHSGVQLMHLIHIYLLI